MRRTLLLLALLAWPVAAVQAQEAGHVTGSVVDARSGDPLGGVNVVVAGTLYGAVTDTLGRFDVGPVPPGRYTVQVNALDHRPESRIVDVASGAASVVDFRLQPPVVELEDVEPGAPQQHLQPVAALSASNIREVNALDAATLLRSLPGVGAGRTGGHTLHTNIRGLADSRVGVYVDGARFLPGSPYGIGTPLGFFDPRAVETIEVVKGPYALTWGAGNLGAVWVATRGANPVQRLRASVQGGYTSNIGGYAATGAVSGGVAGLSYWMQGVYRTGDDYRDGRGRTVPAGFRAVEARGQFAYPFSAAARLTVYAGYQDQQDLDVPGRLLDARSSDAANVSARFQAAWAAGLLRALDATASWNRLDQALDDRARPGAVPVVVVDVGNAQVGGRLAAHLAPTERVTLVAGGDVYRTAYDATPGPRAAAVVLPESHLTVAGLFVGATRDFGRLEASGTLRLDVVRARAAVFCADAGATCLDPEPGDEAHLSASLALSRRLSPRWQASAGLGSVARTADPVERYAAGLPLAGLPSSASVQGDPALAPERSTQADLWLEGEYDRLDLRLGAFARRIDDYITINPIRDLPVPAVVLPFVNSAATFWGVEATAVYLPFRRFLAFSATAGYLWGRDDRWDRPAPGVAPLTGSLGWRLQAPANLFFLEGTLRGAVAQNRVAAALGEASTGGYVAADLHLGVSLPRSSYLLIGFDNLTDAAYAGHLNAQDPFTRVRLTEPGRMFFARFRIAY